MEQDAEPNSEQSKASETETEQDSVSEHEPEPSELNAKPMNMLPGAVKLRSWLNKSLKIEMSDGRILIGVFLCTDRDSNVILGCCAEYLSAEELANNEDPRVLGLVMVPGKHIISIHVDMTASSPVLTESNISNEEVM